MFAAVLAYHCWLSSDSVKALRAVKEKLHSQKYCSSIDRWKWAEMERTLCRITSVCLSKPNWHLTHDNERQRQKTNERVGLFWQNKQHQNTQWCNSSSVFFSASVF